MSKRCPPRISGGVRWLVAAWLSVFTLAASEYRGQVTFGGLPVPGATVTATHDGKKFTAISDSQGIYSFPSLPDGIWTIEIAMTGFSTIKQDVAIAANAPSPKWELKLLPLDKMNAETKPAAGPTHPQPPPANAAAEPQPAASPDIAPSANELTERADNGFLINGSMNNGAASPFAQFPAFGNNRMGGNSLYTGLIGMTLDNSALDAQQFSVTGQNTPKPAYNRLTGLAALGGPLKIPHLMPSGPNFFALYQWTRNRNVTTTPGLMPTEAERNGNLSQLASSIRDPTTGQPFPGSVIPQSRLSPQARALLNFYPLPNFNGSAGYNYQIPIVSPTHQDALQSRFNKAFNFKDQIYGSFAFQSTRADSPNLFGFLDTTDLLGINTTLHWSHRFGQRLFMNVGYQFSRLSNRLTPYFENRENVSGLAGISGNNQEPVNWGPPALAFSSIAGLSDGLPSFNRNQTGAVSYSMLWSRSGHNIMFGGDFRRQEFNYLSQQNPRGSFTFTGAATGSDFAGFLLGIPDTSSIAFGNADKYFRDSLYDAFITDDWRINPELTVNIGVRWEYGSPITELYGRLVNLDVAPGFAAVAPVVANDPVGPLTGQRYPDSLIRQNKSAFEPRVGIAWRPLSGSSLVVRAGYGTYYNTSVYQTIAAEMAQQPPLSKSFSVSNSPANPLTLANGFNASPSTTPNTFAIDPNFRVGYAQEWQLSVQRDLPGSLQMTATYLGIKGTRGVQEFLPNTYPIGAASPCHTCPIGFAYVTSNGNSSREAASIQLRRRLHNGLTGTLQYTFSKSIDNDAVLGGGGAYGVSQSATPNSGAQSSSGPGTAASSGTSGASSTAAPTASSQPTLAIAQNWLDLSAERSLSNFDQRHLLTAQLQYTTGMGTAGGTLLSGWRGALFKEWSFATEISAGTGLPLTPVYFAAVPGTGVTDTIRAEYTGAPLYAAPSGLFLNPAAYTAPLPGQWGNAGRNSITGPAEFALNASMGRTFRVSDRFNLDLRIDSTNALNNVTYQSWNTTVNGRQFGLPTAANAMRSLEITMRLRF
jgi:trimeric autotransporter adhesin